MPVSLTYHGTDLGTYESLEEAFSAATKQVAPHCLLNVLAETGSKSDDDFDGWSATCLAEHVSFEVECVSVDMHGKIIVDQRCIITPARDLRPDFVREALSEIYGGDPVAKAPKSKN